MNDNTSMKMQFHPGAVWEYKGVEYRVLQLDVDLRTQHPVTGLWDATVIYTTVEQQDDRVAPLRFARTGTEFIEKFRYLRTH